MATPPSEDGTPPTPTAPLTWADVPELVKSIAAAMKAQSEATVTNPVDAGDGSSGDTRPGELS